MTMGFPDRKDRPGWPIEWWRCEDCGHEEKVGVISRCDYCRRGNVHLISNRDGEMPKDLSVIEGQI